MCDVCVYVCVYVIYIILHGVTWAHEQEKQITDRQKREQRKKERECVKDTNDEDMDTVCDCPGNKKRNSVWFLAREKISKRTLFDMVNGKS